MKGDGTAPGCGSGGMSEGCVGARGVVRVA